MKDAEVSRILSVVAQLLEKTALAQEFDLRVEPELTKSDDVWVYVGVAPHKAGVRAYEFAELLAAVEQNARAEAKKQEILLVPVRLNGTTNGTH